MPLWQKGYQSTLSHPSPKARPSGPSSGQIPFLYSGAAMASKDPWLSSSVPVRAPPKAARSAAVAYRPPVPTTPRQSMGKIRS